MRKRPTINGDCFIVLYHSFRDHEDELKEHREEFGSVGLFDNYLHWSPEKSIAIGHAPDLTDPRLLNPRISNVRLAIWVDGKETPLANIDQLTSFLDSHPDVADRLQYKSKR